MHNHAQITAFDISPDSSLGVSYGGDETLAVFHGYHGKRLLELLGHVLDVYSIRILPSGVLPITAGADMILRLYTLDDGKLVREYAGHKRRALDWTRVYVYARCRHHLLRSTRTRTLFRQRRRRWQCDCVACGECDSVA